jgi:hypothetical protein
VLHFLLAAEIRATLKKMHRWLRPEGRLYLVVDTPYSGFWFRNAPEYEKRKAAGEEWPGLIEDIAPYHPSGQCPPGMLPYLNPMDPDILVRECEGAGFEVEEAEFIYRRGIPGRDARRHAGAIAVKPATGKEGKK